MHRWIVGLVAFSLIPLAWFAVSAKTNTQDFENWIESNSRARSLYNQFTDLFGLDDYVIISWEGCVLGEPTIDELGSLIVELDEKWSHESGSDKLVSRVISGNDIVEELTHPPVNLPLRIAKGRLRGIFLGDNGRQTCLSIQLSRAGTQNRRQAMKNIKLAIEDTPNLSYADIMIGGNSFLNNELDIATNQSMVFALPACIVAITLAWLLMRDLKITIFILVVSGIAALCSVALVPMMGFQMNGLLVLMPVLVLVVTMSSAVHLGNGFRRELTHSTTVAEAVEASMRKGRKPVLFAMTTTALGVGSLCISGVSAVREFGFFSALSILIGLLLLLGLLPALIHVFFFRTTPSKTVASITPTVFKNEPTSRFWAHLIVIFGFAAIVSAAFGLRKIQSDLNVEKLFPKNHKVVSSHFWLQKNVIPLRAIELVISFPDHDDINMFHQVRLVRRLQAKLFRHELVNSSFSVASWIHPFPKSKSLTDFAAQSIIDQRLTDNQSQLTESGFFAKYQGKNYWRATFGVYCEDPESLIKLKEELEDSANQIVKNDETAIILGHLPDFFVTGVWTLASTGQNQLFHDLVKSFLLALAVISPVMMLLLRGVAKGGLAMIPNVAPPVLFFGTLGWLGYEIDIGTMLTASVGLGIAVDNTFHLLHWFRHYLDIGTDNDRQSAVNQALQHCRPAMIQTTIICGAGLLVFAFSQFVPVRQFSISIAVILALAVLSDLVFLPAVIVSPLGRIFGPTQKQS